MTVIVGIKTPLNRWMTHILGRVSNQIGNLTFDWIPEPGVLAICQHWTGYPFTSLLELLNWENDHGGRITVWCNGNASRRRAYFGIGEFIIYFLYTRRHITIPGSLHKTSLTLREFFLSIARAQRSRSCTDASCCIFQSGGAAPRLRICAHQRHLTAWGDGGAGRSGWKPAQTRRNEQSWR